MATAYCDGNIISRSRGNSSVAAAAYRSGEKLYNEREGVTYSYAHKRGIVYSEILTPEHAPAWAKDRAKLWNAVEKIEKQHDAQLAREFVIALPKELTRVENIALTRAYAQTFVNDGMVADVSIHDKGDGNPHAHIMLTMRPFREDGAWGTKCRKEYILDDEGQKIKLKSGQYKSRKVNTTNWDTLEKFMEWRKTYEHITNDYLEKAGYKERISVESYEAQGVDKIPTKHMGYYACELEQQGIPSVLGNINREIAAENQRREALKSQLAQVEEARRAELARLEESQREAAKRHQRKYVRPSDEESSRKYAHPKSFDEQLAEKTQEYRERKRRQREREDDLGHEHTHDR